MVAHFADRLSDAIRTKNAPVCVGIDPLIEHAPAEVRRHHRIDDPRTLDPFNNDHQKRALAAIHEYGSELIRVIALHVPAIKINIAFFECYGADGLRVYLELIREAKAAGLIVIGDIKRADIGHSSTQYARAHLGLAVAGRIRDDLPHAVTVNPYFGYDAIRPFVETARIKGGGLFVLVQTSNESADQVQGLTFSDGQNLAQRVAGLVETWAVSDGLIGQCGYSCIGAVVSPRDLPSTKRIRSLMPHCLFLVPGFGAQGRTAEEVAHCFKHDGTGALVTASRSVIYAYEDRKQKANGDWRAAIDQACREFVQTVKEAVPPLLK